MRAGGQLASEAECEQALRSLADMLARVDPEVRAKYVQERTVSLRLSDLDVTWSGRLCDEGLADLTTGDDGRTQVRLTLCSDDLIALSESRLSVPTAFATGRLRVQASPFDLLRLGSFF